MPVHLITELELDRIDAADRTSRDLVENYLRALRAGDELGMRRYEALAADFDVLNPDSPSVLDELDGLHTPAAA